MGELIMLLDTIPITLLNSNDNTYDATVEDELVLGLAGNDKLSNSGAPAFLAGGSGNDTYRPSYDGGSLIVENVGDGTDVWVDPKSAPGGGYQAFIFTGLPADSRQLHLLIANADGDSIIVVNFFGNAGIEKIVIGEALASIVPQFSIGETVSHSALRNILGDRAIPTTVQEIGLSNNQAGLLEDIAEFVKSKEPQIGTNGNNTFKTTKFSDFIDGRGGFDTVDFRGLTAGRVIVNLEDSSANGGFAAGDVYNSIERVLGGALDDSIRGNSARNYLFGDNGNDTLRGGNGDDELEGGAGADVLSGGLGTDTAIYAPSSGGVTADLSGVVASSGGALGDTFDGIENLRGSQRSDVLFGDGGANFLEGKRDDDSLRGKGGDDILDGGKDGDFLHGGGGLDTATYASSDSFVILDLQARAGNSGDSRFDTFVSIEIFEGSSFDDVMRGDETANIFDGSDGDDSLSGRGGNDVLDGQKGDDNLDGSSGDDELDGGTGADNLLGGSGLDKLNGGNGSDVVRGGDDADEVRGGAASDTLFGDGGNDLILGQGGADRLFGGTGNDIGKGGGSPDELFGGAGRDRLFGNGGLDDLNGGADNDVLIGGGGGDTLRGDAGNDKLKGKAGADVFVFSMGDERDVIADFQDTLDKIDFSNFGFANVTEAKNFASNVSADVVFDFGGGDMLIVLNLQKANLNSADFIL